MCDYAEVKKNSDGLCRFKFVAGDKVLCANQNPNLRNTVRCEDAGRQMLLVQARWKRATEWERDTGKKRAGKSKSSEE